MEGFTSQVAAAEMGEREAKFKKVMPQRRPWDVVLGIMSFVALPIFLALQALLVLLFLPSLACKCRAKRTENASEPLQIREDLNISTEEGGSFTAIVTLAARAQGFSYGIGPDALAARFMEHVSVIGNPACGGLTLTCLLLKLLHLYWRLFRRSFFDLFSRCGVARIGVFAYLQVRTHWLDDVVATFGQQHRQETWNLVILGAGYDTRCYRLPLDAEVKRFEVDAPGTQKQKLRVLEQCGISCSETVFVSCNFATQSWVVRLKEHGFDDKQPSCFVWEGVLYYLPLEAVTATLKEIGAMTPGTVIAFDFFWKDWCMATAARVATQRIRERFKTGLDRDDLWRLLEANQLECAELLGYTELGHRYLPKHPDGRCVDFLGDFGGFVVAHPRK